MPAIEVRNLTKTFGSYSAVDDISFSAEPGEIVVIVGESGCGKTTTLRMIAGLERPTSGTIAIEGQLVASAQAFVAPERRGVGMVFQSYALWPHMTIFDNIAYGLKLKNTPAAKIRDAVGQVMELVGLEGLADRYPSTLSGGQQQRVALARSIVAEPKVLLLDEPLSNLDAKLREQMRLELRRLIKKLHMTAVHITHDQTEAMALADTIIYMRKGRAEQRGAPRDLYRAPVSRSVADFIGTATFFDGTIVRKDPVQGVLVRISDAVELWSKATAEREVTVALRPESLILSGGRPEGVNVLPGTIVEEVFLGEYSEYLVEISGLRVKVRTSGDFAVGTPVFLSIDPARVLCLANERR